MKPTITSSEIVHQNPWYRVRLDNVLWPNGKPGQFFVTEITDGAVIVCIKDQSVLVVKQYRPAVQLETIEFPCGGIDQGENPLQGAQRELHEETGYEAKTWQHLGDNYAEVGCSHNHQFYFLASDIEQHVRPELDMGEASADLQYEWMPIETFEHLILTTNLIPQGTMTAWLRYLLHTGRAHSLLHSKG